MSPSSLPVEVRRPNFSSVSSLGFVGKNGRCISLLISKRLRSLMPVPVASGENRSWNPNGARRRFLRHDYGNKRDPSTRLDKSVLRIVSTCPCPPTKRDGNSRCEVRRVSVDSLASSKFRDRFFFFFFVTRTKFETMIFQESRNLLSFLYTEDKIIIFFEGFSENKILYEDRIKISFKRKKKERKKKKKRKKCKGSIYALERFPLKAKWEF